MSALTIEGGLLSPDIVERIVDLEGQRPGDFGLNPNRTMADAIAGDFAALCMDWRNFQSRLEDARPGDSLTTLTRRQWVAPLLNRLGYEIETLRPAPVVDGRAYAISHRADGAEDAPVVHIVAVDQPLGERPAPGRGSIAPHALVQDYLNRTEQLWGIVTNGHTLRLLRDSSYFTRPSYIEFDLRQIFGGEQLDEFILLYRLAHRSRLPADSPQRHKDTEGRETDESLRLRASVVRPEHCLLERYHLQALEQGDRIRDGLRGAVEQAILALGNGLLRHPRNEELRADLRAGSMTTRAFYQQLLYLIYRFLFLLVAEERGLLIHHRGGEAQRPDKTEESLRLRASVVNPLDYYRAYYSLARLRVLADEPLTAPERFDDLWLGLQTLFYALRDEALAGELDLPPLNGPLFAENRLDLTLVSNRDLLLAVRAFSSFTPPGESVRRRVNYSALDVEELGSVYEALLDYQPLIEPDALYGLRFVFAAGTDRRSTGSYYTDRKLVNELVEAALVPAIRERLAEIGLAPQRHRGTEADDAESLRLRASVVQQKKAAPQRHRGTEADDAESLRLRASVVNQQEAALLSIKVLDPACGSGHFLLAAARRIGRELARVRAGGDEPSADAVRAATREAIAHCVYGVDRNELAVDLCKVALWIEGQAEGKPLSFLDHRIRHGDSLVGVLRNQQLRDGIPDAAYDAAPGDDKPTARALKKRNKQEREGQQELPLLRLREEQAQPAEAALLSLPDDTPEIVRRKRAAFAQMRALGTPWWHRQLANHLYTAAFFTPLVPGGPVPTSAMLEDVDTVRGDVTGAAVGMAAERAFFHWEQEFPEVFHHRGTKDTEAGPQPAARSPQHASPQRHKDTESAIEAPPLPPQRERGLGGEGGFDVVLGNPPFVGGLKISTNYSDKYRAYISHAYDPFKGTSDLCAAFFRRVFTLLREGGAAGIVATNTIGQGDTREAGLGQIVQQGGVIHYARRFVKWSGDASVEVNLVGWKKGSWDGKLILDLAEVEQISSRLDNEPEQEPFTLQQNENKAFIGDFVRGIGFVIDKAEAGVLFEADTKNSDCIAPYLNGQDINRDPDQKPSRYVVCFRDWPLSKAKKYPDALKIVIERVKPERDKVKEKHERENWWLFARYRGEMRTAVISQRKVLVRSRISETHAVVFVPNDWVFNEKTIVFAFDDDYHFALLQSNPHELWMRRFTSTLRTDINYAPSDCFENFPFPQQPAAEAQEWAARVGEEYHEQRRQLMLAQQQGLTKTYNRFHNPAETSEEIAQLRALHAELDKAILACYGWEDLEPGHGFHQNERGQTRYTVSDAARREILARLLKLNLEVAAQEANHKGTKGTKG
ncbi:N-6 DNA methylase [Chloroflexales bacterium ZM16-3]|nr:N-6 DNA methylase [Chloroflexales bacterium ZM16-3]